MCPRLLPSFLCFGVAIASSLAGSMNLQALCSYVLNQVQVYWLYTPLQLLQNVKNEIIHQKTRKYTYFLVISGSDPNSHRLHSSNNLVDIFSWEVTLQKVSQVGDEGTPWCRGFCCFFLGSLLSRGLSLWEARWSRLYGKEESGIFIYTIVAKPSWIWQREWPPKKKTNTTHTAFTFLVQILSNWIKPNSGLKHHQASYR